MTIVEFLLDRLADEERAANDLQAAYEADLVRVDASLVNYSALSDPVRVLADVAAKRQIIDLCVASDDGTASPSQLILADDILRSLVQPYAQHPSFDPAWGTT